MKKLSLIYNVKVTMPLCLQVRPGGGKWPYPLGSSELCWL